VTERSVKEPRIAFDEGDGDKPLMKAVYPLF